MVSILQADEEVEENPAPRSHYLDQFFHPFINSSDKQTVSRNHCPNFQPRSSQNERVGVMLNCRIAHQFGQAPVRNFQFCTTQGIVIYIFSINQKSKFFSVLKKFSLSSFTD